MNAFDLNKKLLLEQIFADDLTAALILETPLIVAAGGLGVPGGGPRGVE
jgi:hypothetical protein